MDWRLKRLTGWTLALLLCGVGMGTLPLAAESVPAPPPTAGDSDRQLTVNLEIFLEAVRRVEDDCRSGRIKNLPDQQLVQSHQMLSQILAACTELRCEYAAIPQKDSALEGRMLKVQQVERQTYRALKELERELSRRGLDFEPTKVLL